MLPTLVMKLSKERYDVQIQILETLHNCIRLGKEPLNPTDALRSNALEELTLLIQKSPVTDIKVAASKCIMVLT
jgi:hypothetical protein